MDNEKITYEQAMEYCRSHNYALVDKEFLHIILGDKPMELWGLPIEDVKRVVEIYKYKGVVPTTDYTDGFRDGLKHAEEQYDKTTDNLIKNMIKCLSNN